jgi:hypothetical protein
MLLIVVAGVGLLCFAVMTLFRFLDYQERARWHALVERNLRNFNRSGRWTGDALRRGEEAAEREALLKRKYERAARYPWLPVAPDLPEPK